MLVYYKFSVLSQVAELNQAAGRRLSEVLSSLLQTASLQDCVCFPAYLSAAVVMELPVPLISLCSNR